jgi:nucleotide-binding universal stress UspA family protein
VPMATRAGSRARHVAEIMRRGDPVKETLTETQKHGIELITVGARHRRIMDFLTIGRTTERIGACRFKER